MANDGTFKKGFTPWNKGSKGIMRPNHTVFKKGMTPWNKGKHPEYMRGKNNPMYGKKQPAGTIKKISLACAGRVPWNKGKKHTKISGSKNPNWKGGVTSVNEKIRKSIEYKLWREAVFKRDNYACVWCRRSVEVSGKLNSDHIKPFALFPELRFAIDNGRTLCEDCHKTTDTYLWKTKKK